MTVETSRKDPDPSSLSLPESLEALQSLLADVKVALDDIDLRIALDEETRFWFEQISQGGGSKDGVAAIADRLDQLMQVGVAIDIPGPAHLWLYLPPEALTNWSSGHHKARQQLERALRQARDKRLNQVVRAIRLRLETDTALSILLNLVVVNIYHELERLNGSKRAERKTENKKSLRNAVPNNVSVLELARLLNKPANADRKKREVAMELTNGDEVKAENLLRQLRSFPNLLNERRRGK